MAAQWPRVLNRLLTLLPTLDGWGGVKVIDGPPVDDNVTSLYCTVGYVENDQAGSYIQRRDPSGARLVETGTVRCQLVVQDERNNLSGARAKVFPVADALEAAIRANYTLGVLSPDSSSDITSEVQQIQTPSGPFVSVIFTLTYSTVT